jgi:threonine aldolase
MALADIAAAIKPDDPHFARTRLLCLENTWNGHVHARRLFARRDRPGAQRGLAVHLDGARLFNAAVASGVPAGRVRHADHFDSLSRSASARAWARPWARPCAARAIFIARAHRVRKMAGGGMRQAGLLAAARCMRWTTTSSAWPTTTPTPSAWPMAWPARESIGLGVAMPQTNIVFAWMWR